MIIVTNSKKYIMVAVALIASAQVAEGQIQIVDVNNIGGGKVTLFNCGEQTNLNEFAILEQGNNNKITKFSNVVLNHGESYTVDVDTISNIVLMDDELLVVFDSVGQLPDNTNWGYRTSMPDYPLGVYTEDHWLFGHGGLPQHEVGCNAAFPIDVVSFETVKTLFR